MLIDFHTHAFPNSIAEKTIEKLAATAHTVPHHNGTVEGLCRAAEDGGIDRSVVLPVLTAPRQFESVNRFAAEHNGQNGLIFFGGIHPDNEQPEDKLDTLQAMGFQGIKLHPDYQNTYLSDARYIRIVRHCVRIGMTVVTHAGQDPLCPDNVHATVEDIERLLDGVYRGDTPDRATLVLAHLGGAGQLEAVEDRLAGAPVYLDTAFMLDRVPAEQVVRLCRRHGTERVLFATDSPWGDPREFVRIFRTLPFTEEEQQNILWRNAASLLGIIAPPKTIGNP